MAWDTERFMRDLQRLFNSHEIAALEHVEPLARLLHDNPEGGIRRIVDAYNKGLNSAYTKEDGTNIRGFIEAVAGGPYQTVPWAVYNAIGAVYPYLDRRLKDLALGKIVYEIFDGLNYGYVNGARGEGHTTGIREPLLLADIGIIRPLYWPGLREAEFEIKKYSNFFDLQKELVKEDGLFDPRKVNSDFLLAYSLLRSDFCNFGEDYIKAANPRFLERTLQGIVWLRFGGKDGNTSESIEAGNRRLRELLPESLHNRIEPLRQEGGWVDYKKFNPGR